MIMGRGKVSTKGRVFGSKFWGDASKFFWVWVRGGESARIKGRKDSIVRCPRERGGRKRGGDGRRKGEKVKEKKLFSD